MARIAAAAALLLLASCAGSGGPRPGAASDAVAPAESDRAAPAPPAAANAMPAPTTSIAGGPDGSAAGSTARPLESGPATAAAPAPQAWEEWPIKSRGELMLTGTLDDRAWRLHVQDHRCVQLLDRGPDGGGGGGGCDYPLPLGGGAGRHGNGRYESHFGRVAANATSVDVVLADGTRHAAALTEPFPQCECRFYADYRRITAAPAERVVAYDATGREIARKAEGWPGPA